MKRKFLLKSLLIIAVFSSIISLSVNTTAASNGFKVSGSKLLDSNGNEFILKGINHPHTWFESYTETALQAISKMGANSVRVVLSDGQQANWGKDSSESVKKVIDLCEKNKLICILEVHDVTGLNEIAPLLKSAQYFADLKTTLVGHESTVIINIANEWGSKSWDQASVWADGYKQAIPIIRNAGLTHTIMVDAGGWGQQASTISDYGQSILATDTLKNTLFSFHGYGTAAGNASTIKTNIDNILSKGLCLCIGEFGYKHSDGEVDESYLMSYCEQKKVGWLAWSWKGNSGGVEYLDLVNDWEGTSLTEFGKILVNDPNGIKTAKTCSIFSTQPTSTIKLGDVNGDGKITSTDSALVQRHILGQSDLSGNGLIAADVNKDNKINSTDDSLITRIVLGMNES